MKQVESLQPLYPNDAHYIDTITNLFEAANRNPRMGNIYSDFLERWRDAGGTVMNIFSSMGAFSQYGCWGLTENYEGINVTPKYIATEGFQQANTPAWWLNTPAPNPPAGKLMINFSDTAITGTCTFKQTFQLTGDTLELIPFSDANTMNLFNCPGYPQGEFYGGLKLQFSPGPGSIFNAPSLNSMSDYYHGYDCFMGNPSGLPQLLIRFRAG